MIRSRCDSRNTAFPVACLLTCYLIFTQAASAGVTQWVDIEVINGHLMVDTAIAGIPGRSIIDTGASVNAINGRFLEAQDLSFPKGEQVKIIGVHSTSLRNSYRTVPVNIFGSEVDFKGLVDLDFGPPEIQMILGAGFLRLFVFQIDYPNQRMRAITRDSVDQKTINNVKSIRDPQGGAPIVKVRLNDEKDVWLVMDTGNSGGILLQRSLAKKQKWLDRYSTVDGFSVGVNSGGRMQRFNLPRLTFGGFEIENPIVSVPAEGETIDLFKNVTFTGSRLQRSRSKAKGLLGYDVLKHFVVTVDFKSGRVHVEPGNTS